MRKQLITLIIMLFESVAMQKIPQNEKAIDNLFKVINGFLLFILLGKEAHI